MGEDGGGIAMEQGGLTERIIGAAIEVHRTLGPSLLESTYESCLVHELVQEYVRTERQVPIPVRYKGVTLDCGYRIDPLVEGSVVELKAVDKVLPIHEAQLIAYLRLGGFPVGLLINFNVRLFKDGIPRRANTGHSSAFSALSAVNPPAP